MIVLLFLVAVFAYFYRELTFWRRRGVPQSSQWTPLGDMWDVGTRFHYLEKLDLMYRQFRSGSPFFGLYLISSPAAVITDLDLLRSILVKDFSNFVNRGLFHSQKDALSLNLINLEGDKWRRMRNMVSPTFTSGRMKGMFFILEDKGRDLVAYLSSHRKHGIYVRDAYAKFTCDIVASTAFGLETGALRSDETPRVLEMLQNSMLGDSMRDTFNRFFITAFQSLSSRFGFRQFNEELERYFSETIRHTVDHRERNSIKRNDFLHMLINIKNRGTILDHGEVNEEGKLTFKEFLAQAFIYFVGGFDTSSIAMSFAIYFVARHSEVQERLRQEIREVKARHGGKISYEAVMEMTYLNQVFNETLRLFPPVSILVRKTTESYKVPGTNQVLPKGVMIQVPTYSIHRDPAYYPKPEEFDPERFSPESVAQRHPYAFLPFGEGPRNCIGMRFAQLQTKFGLALTVDNFKVSVNARTREPLRLKSYSLITDVEGGLWIDFTEIEK